MGLFLLPLIFGSHLMKRLRTRSRYYGPGNVCNQQSGPRDMSGLPLYNSNYA